MIVCDCVHSPTGRYRPSTAIDTLDACLKEGGDDPAFIAAALGNVARARGIGELAEKTGMTRAGLYKALGKDGNPSFGAVLKVVRAMGLELHIAPQR